MAKVTLTDLTSIANGSSAVTEINNNNAAIETALENTLSRDGTAPNSMEADFDMNSNRILNLPEPLTETEPLRLGDVDLTVNGALYLTGTSETSNTVGTGSKTWTTETGRLFNVGQYVTIQTAPGSTSPLMYGQVTAYSGSTLTVNVQRSTGSGTYADWIIYVSGAPSELAALADGDYGDVSSSSGVITIDSNVISDYGRTLVDDADAATARSTLGLVIGTNVQAFDADLTTWAGVTPTAAIQTFLATPSSANLAAAITDETGSGASVFATSPTLVTPILGTPTSGTLTNCTGLPISTGVSGLGTGVATFLATPSSANLAAALTDETGSGANVFATSPTLVTPILGTPTSGTLTNCTGLPVSTGISGLGTGVATFLATPSSANLASAITDETGSGALVFATSPTLVTPVLGTPTSGTLTNCTGLPTAGLVANAVTNAKLAQMATQTFKGRTTAGTGDPEDLTATQATAILNAMVGDSGSGGTKGLVPAPAAGDATKFLRGDGTFQAIPGGGDALTTNPLSQFAATTSAELAGVISDETGSGALVFATSPTLVTPTLGAASATSLMTTGAIELGHATDTTLARSAAGKVTIEGAQIATLTSGDSFIATQTIETTNARVLEFKRSNDGTISGFYSAGTQQGYISVSGTTVTYGTFLGSHWSQLKDNSMPAILDGTVMESIDELCYWPQDSKKNEHLPKVKISDTPGSRSVYGVFLWWDQEDPNDMYVGSIGTYKIRVNKNQKVKRGDYLESNGDGTARVQKDDILRSSTVAKVTSNHIIETYADGSYTVPCTLHCG